MRPDVLTTAMQPGRGADGAAARVEGSCGSAGPSRFAGCEPHTPHTPFHRADHPTPSTPVGGSGVESTPVTPGLRRWLQKYSHTLQSMLPFDRVRQLARLHGKGVWSLSEADTLALVSELGLTGQQAMQRGASDSTNNLVATLGHNQETEEFVHAQQVAAGMRRMRAAAGGGEEEEEEAGDSAETQRMRELISYMQATEAAVVVIQRAFRAFAEVWNKTSPQDRARIRARYRRAVRGQSERRRAAADKAEEAEQERRQAEDEALPEVERSTLGGAELAQSHSRQQRHALQSQPSCKPLGFGSSQRDRADASGGALTPRGQATSPATIRVRASGSSSGSGSSGNNSGSSSSDTSSGPSDSDGDTGGSGGARRAGAAGRAGAGRSSSASALYGAGGMDLVAMFSSAASPEEMAAVLRREVAKRVDAIVASSEPIQVEDLPQMRRINELLQQASQVKHDSEARVSEVVAQDAAAVEAMKKAAEEEAVVCREQLLRETEFLDGFRPGAWRDATPSIEAHGDDPELEGQQQDGGEPGEGEETVSGGGEGGERGEAGARGGARGAKGGKGHGARKGGKAVGRAVGSAREGRQQKQPAAAPPSARLAQHSVRARPATLDVAPVHRARPLAGARPATAAAVGDQQDPEALAREAAAARARADAREGKRARVRVVCAAARAQHLRRVATVTTSAGMGAGAWFRAGQGLHRVLMAGAAAAAVGRSDGAAGSGGDGGVHGGNSAVAAAAAAAVYLLPTIDKMLRARGVQMAAAMPGITTDPRSARSE
ncbi:hypothetical protein FOA52_010328 [Chlamydomonas sp. UWO 241]|nr:hypothetical protein FOA52_010328 [Chlamydomonas sp. UWO 241]